MSHEKLNLNLLGENSNEGTASSNHRRKWHSNPIGARRYHELVNTESQKDSLALQLLKNLSYTKRNVSELIEKSKMTEWLKMSPSKVSFDYSGLSSDSGVSLCTSGDNEDGQEWQNNSSNSLANTTTANKWNIGISSSDTLNNAGELLSNSLREVNDGTNDYDDLKDFYTPRSCWEEVGNFKDDDHTQINQRSGLSSSRGEPVSSGRLPGTKRVGRSADILARVQKSPSFSKKAEDLIVERNDNEGVDRSIITARINRPGGSISSVGRSEGLLSKNKICARKFSERCLRLKEESSTSELTTSENNVKSSNERKSEHSSGIAKSLIHLAQIKRSNKNAVENFLKNLAGSSNENPVTDLQCNFADQEHKEKEDILENNSSNEYLKWNFPNSNRKREEKLRSLEKEVAEYNLSAREESVCSNHLKNNEITKLTNRYHFDTTFNEGDSQSTLMLDNNTMDDRQSDFKISSYVTQRYLPTTVSDADVLILPGHMEAGSPDETIIQSKNIREMNTQAALIYLSETLIESAQRAEMLLMQKMKEYNDLVCRDPPQKKTQDFTCQVQTIEPQSESNFETRLNIFKDKLTQELDNKNIRIKQLETDKKKLRQALKKLNSPSGKKCEGTLINGRDIDGGGDNLTPRSVSTEQSTLKERNENHGEFVQALKIENNLLHTLLKEMKAELDQENATILSLAKKLEMSLGKQTIVKSRQQTDVVRKLEDRLEQQEKLLKQETMEARAVAKYVILKYKKLIQEYKQKVKCHQETVDKLTNAIK